MIGFVVGVLIVVGFMCVVMIVKGNKMNEFDIVDVLKLFDKFYEDWCDEVLFDVYVVFFEEVMECFFILLFNDEKCEGIFVCVVCYLLFFMLEMKYDSGIGWLSFFDLIEGYIGIKCDFKFLLLCIEYYCICCGGYQGYVFSDGL